MENWGLVTYRETCLLVDDQNTSTQRRQWVAIVVGHELAHQWFGNLVTMVNLHPLHKNWIKSELFVYLGMVDSFVAERRLRHVRRIALRRPSLPRVQNLDAIRHRHFHSGLGSRQFEEFASHRSANRPPGWNRRDFWRHFLPQGSGHHSHVAQLHRRWRNEWYNVNILQNDVIVYNFRISDVGWNCTSPGTSTATLLQKICGQLWARPAASR